MSKRFFTFLIVLMGLSILGVISIQLVWINSAIKIKNELFDRSINEALSQTVQRLELDHDIDLIAGFPKHKFTSWTNNSTPKTPTPPRPVKIIREFKKSGDIEFEFEMDTDEDVQVYTMSTTGEKNKSHQVIISNRDTVLTTTDIILASSEVHLDSIQEMVNAIVRVAPVEISPNIQERIEFKTENLKKLTRKVVAEISTEELDSLDIIKIQEIVQAELTDKNIAIDFDMAILLDDSIQSISNKADSLQLMSSLYQVRLFPNAIFDQNRKLSLFFPAQNKYIYRSVSWLLAASFLFSTIILLTFALSIYFILRQKKVSEMKSDFINNMTHEFKTPIATISVAADSISNEKVIGDREQINYFVGMIKKENTRMNRQVEDILTIARLDKKDFDFNWEATDIHHIIEDAIQSIILQVERRGGTIESKINASNPMVTTDRNHCTNLIYNLLDNANKYSPDKPEITVETKNDSTGVIIMVSDKGIGMSKQVQSRIFERFYRQSSGNIHNVKGFGLGLSYLKAVLEANQGTISVQSEPAKGSRFEVHLPFLRT